MRDFFGFSDEYKVKKKISVEKFLGSVNATEKERERLNHAIMMLDWMNCFRNERKRNTIKEYRISEYLQSLLETTSSFLSYKELDTFGDEDDPEKECFDNGLSKNHTVQ